MSKPSNFLEFKNREQWRTWLEKNHATKIEAWLVIFKKKYHDQGLEILGFPCNQFMNQEPGSNEDIQNFCQVNYGVTFPMFAKIDVNGADTHPLYTYLKQAAPGMLGMKAIKWNFTKFLVDAEGKVVKRFAPNVEPADIGPEIEALL